MKPSFHARPVNGPFEDPCVYVRILREKRALLFDLGYIGRLELGNLLKITDIFVTHMHMDHFAGFDIILRNILRRAIPLRIFGPENITSCVEGKLKGYTWNLIKDYPLKIEVFEIKDNSILQTNFYAENAFEKIVHDEKKFNGILIDDPLFKATGLILSHQIPVMAFSLEEDFHININKAMIEDRKLPVGPWLSSLKKAIREKQKSENRSQKTEKKIFEISNKVYSLEELMDIATITKGQKISYVMDISPVDENVEKIIPFVRDSDILFCEAYFLEKDRDRAEERHHLTAAIAGRIAREANVGSLEIMHFSPKYRHCIDELYNEAMREFRG
ncbi:ribonuclease Z [Dissulfurispira thermophila]|uniref:Ribonuclease Z n=1 Tax=Dissulfurispira thermophila TaxID=2715679 RepID=A0A7G1H3G3_9BACT|nr:ribonuclease Z [Dissulfurispira thermophila]BCB97345.1 ribonuclease Z [Dissulfurispira thermophila]